MKEMGMGNDRCHLIDLDNGDTEITAKEAVKGISASAANGFTTGNNKRIKVNSNVIYKKTGLPPGSTLASCGSPV